jgi:uroporphyrinogen decarboxylase
MNPIFLNALQNRNENRPPVWFMRQAGRFLPQYRAVRKLHGLGELFRSPELAAEVTRMPVEILGVDAAILFSDILLIGEVFGWKIFYPEGGGIRVQAPEREERHDVEEKLQYVKKTIEILKPDLEVPLIGFCGGPYTVAKYLGCIEPVMLEKITEASITYLKMQIAAGVDAVQIFDSWAADAMDVALPYLKKMVDALRGFPVIVFCRGSCRFVKELVALQPTAISFDWEEDLATLRTQVPKDIAIQGNLDPEIFRGPLPLLKEAVFKILESMEGENRFIFNLGHGVLPDTPVENGIAVVQWLKSKLTQEIL